MPAARSHAASLRSVTGTIRRESDRRAGRRVRSSLTRIALLTASVPVAAACVPPPPPPPPPDTYVALGDSFSAGTFIANQAPPPGCFKSDHSYPRLAAPSIHLPKFVDVSCSGATTDHMTNPQPLLTGGSNPPQLDALDNMTGIVTLTIGGNDVGYWSTIADACTSTTAVGTPCQDQFVVNGQDTISQRIAAAAPKVAAVLDGVHQRAPRADVFVLASRPSSPRARSPPAARKAATRSSPMPRRTCRTSSPKQKEINTMIQQQAVAHGATFVDTYTSSIGHDACRNRRCAGSSRRAFREWASRFTRTWRAWWAQRTRCSRSSSARSSGVACWLQSSGGSRRGPRGSRSWRRSPSVTSTSTGSAVARVHACCSSTARRPPSSRPRP